MKNKICLISLLGGLVVSQLHAAPMNIMKDAQAVQDRHERCEKSQERTAQLLKLVAERLDFEAKRNRHHQDELSKRSGDERASYLNAVIIDRSQAMTDIEGFLDKVTKRHELVSSANICSGVADSSNHQYASQLLEASRKLHDEHDWLEKKVQPTTTD